MIGSDANMVIVWLCGGFALAVDAMSRKGGQFLIQPALQRLRRPPFKAFLRMASIVRKLMKICMHLTVLRDQNRPEFLIWTRMMHPIQKIPADGFVE